MCLGFIHAQGGGVGGGGGGGGGGVNPPICIEIGLSVHMLCA